MSSRSPGAEGACTPPTTPRTAPVGAAVRENRLIPDRTKTDDARVRLRPVEDGDLPVLYEHQRDGEASELAAVTSREWGAFAAHWARIRSDPAIVLRTVTLDGLVVGNVLSFVRDGRREVCYWIGREHWGKGIASRALELLVEELEERPLHAVVAAHNPASLRVLEKAGFRVLERRVGEPGPAGDPVEELVLELR